MTTAAIRRPGLLTAVLAVLASALAACGSGPSQINSAIIIGDRVVSVDEIQQRLDTALEVEPAARDLARNRKLDLVSRGIVNQLVRHELIAEAARRQGLTVAESDVTQLADSSASAEDPVQRSVEAAFDRREIARDRLLTIQIGRMNLDQVQLTLNGVALQGPDLTRESMTRLAEQIAAQPDRAEELGAAAAGTGGAQSSPVTNFAWNAIRRYAEASQSAQGEAPSPGALLPQLFAAPPNSVIALSLGADEQSGQWLVARVERSDDGVPPDEAAFATQVPQEWQYILGYHLLSPLAGELGMRVSPRYGVWDELAVGVAPNEAEKIGVVLPVAAPRP